MKRHRQLALKHRGFSLSELLIALLILGQIATFTIPKVLQSQQNGTYKAIAKEVAGTVSAAFQQYTLTNTVTSSTHGKNLTPYLNYVSYHTATTTLDAEQTATTYTCSSSQPCVRLHNGAIIQFYSSFAGTATTNMIQFVVDPDGKVTDGTTNGPGKSITFVLYTTGRLTTYGHILPGTTDSACACHAPDPALDPPWFNWN